MSNIEEPKYQIVEENKDDPKLSKIVVSGLVREISIPDIEHDIEFYKKKVIEKTSDLSLMEAQINKAFESEPKLREISDELLEACFFYCQAKKAIKIAQCEKNDNIEQLEYLERMLKDIELQTGIKINGK